MKSNKKALLLLVGCTFLGASGIAAAAPTLNSVYLQINNSTSFTNDAFSDLKLNITGNVTGGSSYPIPLWDFVPQVNTPSNTLIQNTTFTPITFTPGTGTGAGGMTWQASVNVQPSTQFDGYVLSPGQIEPYTVKCDIGSITATLPPWNGWHRVVLLMYVTANPSGYPVISSCHLGYAS